MKTPGAWLGIFLLCIQTGAAAVYQRDLSSGLTYLRVTADTTGALPDTDGNQAWVLDIRYTNGTDGTVAALRQWMQLQGARQRPVIVLLNAETHAQLAALIRTMRTSGKVLTLGPGSSATNPDIVINQDPASARQAYEALPATGDLKLLTEYIPAKVRYDEAAIVEARSQGQELVEEPEPELSDHKAPDETSAPLIDLALLRAMQIYRAWTILRPAHP